jgi:glutamate/tyrosine decarboxylase-like PLP-dependent enzyme
VTVEELRRRLRRELTADGVDPKTVIEELARDIDPGLVASAGPRFFGFVFGGAFPVTLAADWLVSAWDQNAVMVAGSPGAAALEEIAGEWMLSLLGLPSEAGFAFTTGTQMAHVACLAAARNKVLRDAGWDVEANGLIGAPEVRIVTGENAHITVPRATRILGFGSSGDGYRSVATDGQGRMLIRELEQVLDEFDGPTIVVAQAGDVNSGAVEPLTEITSLCRERGDRVWCHIDGAFGLWAAASPRYRHLVAGHENADSWATDGHKWLNVPYDCGFAAVADPAAQTAAWSMTADYVRHSPAEGRSAFDFTPESSRRARSIPVYAALRFLGREGVADLVDRCCDHAKKMAELLSVNDGIEIINDVVLNQVLVRFDDSDDISNAVTKEVQRSGVCWLGGSVFKGKAVMRISVSGWQTTVEDIELSANAIVTAHRKVHD